MDPAPGVALLEQAGFAVRVLPTDDPERVARAAAETDALLVGGYMPVTAELMAALPRLRIVATMSVGYDTVDVDAARARGIWVANVPGAATEEVAVHAVRDGSEPAARHPVPRPRGARRALGRRWPSRCGGRAERRSASSVSAASAAGSPRWGRPCTGG